MRKLILGSDWWTDCDDAVAVRVICTAHKQGLIRLLGVSIDSCGYNSVRSLDVFMKNEGVDVPIGLDRKGNYPGIGRYQPRLANREGDYRNNEDAEDAVKMYRRLIAVSDETELVEIGFPQVLSALLLSPPDEYSPLSGRELVEQKVKKLWMMAGKWKRGKENNFCRTALSRRAGKIVCKEWPTPITFLGWEVGATVLTGGKLPEGDMLKQILIDYGMPNGRCSWDPMLVTIACLGEEVGYKKVYGKAKLNRFTGVNTFRKGEGNHCYLVKTQPDSYYSDRIDEIIGKGIFPNF